MYLSCEREGGDMDGVLIFKDVLSVSVGVSVKMSVKRKSIAQKSTSI